MEQRNTPEHRRDQQNAQEHQRNTPKYWWGERTSKPYERKNNWSVFQRNLNLILINVKRSTQG